MKKTVSSFRSLCLGFICLGGIVSLSSTYANLPDLGSPSRAVFSDRDEQALGKVFVQSVQASHQLFRDPVVTYFIEQIGQQ
jgi:predicted Zn-dependent protease